jgi:hypothetical protein
MITLIIGTSIIVFFLIMFYLEDKEGGGIYDPDPRPKNKHSK